MDNMKAFVDLHHAGLFESLRRLFEDRLGWELYAPIGREWFTEGYWKIAEPYNNASDTIDQFLGFHQESLEKELRLNEFNEELEEGISKVYDRFHKVWIKKITFDKFTKTKFDVVISSIPQHEIPYADLITKYQPKAKLIAQIGNEGQRPNFDVVKNVMASVIPFKFPKGTNIVYYHQEFDLNLFRYHKPLTPSSMKTIVSVMNGLPNSVDGDLYKEYKSKMPDFEFFSYGGGCEDGSVHSIKELRNKLVMADFVWHLKQFDGFGHIIHNAYALGRPIITKGDYYKGKLGGYLLKEDINYIDLNSGSLKQNIDKIRAYSESKKLNAMSISARNNFERLVDYDLEEESIREFLGKLI